MNSVNRSLTSGYQLKIENFDKFAIYPRGSSTASDAAIYFILADEDVLVYFGKQSKRYSKDFFIDRNEMEIQNEMCVLNSDIKGVELPSQYMNMVRPAACIFDAINSFLTFTISNEYKYDGVISFIKNSCEGKIAFSYGDYFMPASYANKSKLDDIQLEDASWFASSLLYNKDCKQSIIQSQDRGGQRNIMPSWHDILKTYQFTAFSITIFNRDGEQLITYPLLP